MPASNEKRKAEIIDGLAEQLGSRLVGAEAERAQRFMRAYFRDVAPEDLVERDPLDLYGASLAQLRSAELRQPGEVKLRVYNPKLEQHGWQSTHTVVEIVNDDMPFLVDSVSMEINRHGLALHLLVHPIVSVVRDAGGELKGLAAADAKGAMRESFIHVEVDRMSDASAMEELAADMSRVLDDVRDAVGDWAAMRAQVGVVLGEKANRRLA